VSTSEPTDTQDRAHDEQGAPDSGEASGGGDEARDAASPNASNGGAQSGDEQSGDEQSGDEQSGDEQSGDEQFGENSAGDEAPSERIQELTEEIEALEQERDEINDKLLRKAAEFENFRKRMEREKRRRYDAGKQDVVEAMLDVLDDLGRSLDAAEELEEKQDAETAYESLRGGVDMVFRKFKDELSSLGVEKIDAEGEPFDENLHEALMQQPAPEGVEPGTVLSEVRTGYKMGDRVIRHSRVIVAS
jgi:molecular chaperone GrpE